MRTKIIISSIIFLGISWFVYAKMISNGSVVKSNDSGENIEDPTLSVRSSSNQKIFKIANKSSQEYHQFVDLLNHYYDNLERGGWSGAVLVAYKGQIMYKRYMGYSDYQKKITNSRGTSFQLASTSKPFTALAILQLAAKGLVTLDREVNFYIPEFPYSGITVRMLLSHRSGLQDYINFANSYWKTTDGYMSNEDLIALIAAKRPALIFSPNSKFKYTNTNYALLASIVERKSHMPFATYLEKNIFTPLKMFNTQVVDPREGMPSNASKCYKGGGYNEYVYNYQDGVFGDKGVYSTVDDMLKWDQSLYTNQLLNAKYIYEAFSPQNLDMKPPRNYGLGWRMYNYPNGEKIIYHNGLWHGNNSCFYRFIKDNFTIIVQCNKFTKSTYNQPSAICDILAKVEKIENKMGAESTEE